MDSKIVFFLIVFSNLGYCQNDCGRSLIASGKIVGGRQVLPGMLPWQVALMRKHIIRDLTLHCGGSIISPEFILTAAHCVEGVSVNSVVVVVGEYNLRENDSTEQLIPVAEFIAHENYRNNFKNDIALVRTSQVIAYTTYVQPICLPDPGTMSQGVAVVSGWGRTSEGGDISPVLQAVAVPIISDRDCQNFYGAQQITETNICAGVTQGGKDSCQGDSGGPLVMQNTNGLFFQAGIVSWGTGCARPQNPGVYTEVVYYLEWISSRINAYRQYQTNFARFIELSKYWRWSI